MTEFVNSEQIPRTLDQSKLNIILTKIQHYIHLKNSMPFLSAGALHM